MYQDMVDLEFGYKSDCKYSRYYQCAISYYNLLSWKDGGYKIVAIS